MRFIRQVVVFDAHEVETESRFWAGMLSGLVVDDAPEFHLSSTPTASGGSGCSQRPAMCHGSGLMGCRGKSTSISMSMMGRPHKLGLELSFEHMLDSVTAE